LPHGRSFAPHGLMTFVLSSAVIISSSSFRPAGSDRHLNFFFW
jgi:hypothetical protein